MAYIKEKLKNLPDKPGVYIMKNEQGEIIYIGKAISLKNRVRQYFKTSGHAGKVGAMVSHINDFEYILTDSELEALILECNLIKKHRPKYNVLLKDDKHYPYIKITMNDEFPKIALTREIKKDKSKYFGPYRSAKAVRDTISLIKKIFPIRTCNRVLKEGVPNGRPCLNYHINQCMGPCLGNVKRSDYDVVIQDVIKFLSGKHDEILRDLRTKMNNASDNMHYELAASYRDKISAIEKISENQKVISTSMQDQDVIALANMDDLTGVQIFFIRSGKLISGEHILLEDTEENDLKDILESYIKQYYSMSTFIPNEILIQHDLEGVEVIEEWLTELRGGRVYIRTPKRGEKLKLVRMAERNALEFLLVERRKKEREYDRTVGALGELKEYLSLKEIPIRIECFDNSNLQGTDPVASMVVFQDGKPCKKDYRRFKIKSVQGPDDFASMIEVITRRFSRGLKEREELRGLNKSIDHGKFSKFPDLIIVDGGKGQLGAALKAISDVGVAHIPVVSLAERNEEIFVQNRKEPIILPKGSNALHLIQRIRDEAHRFAITFHRSLRQKNKLHSVLEDIPGIGSKRRKALLKAFDSVEKISVASLEELCKVEGMNKKAAMELISYFRG